MNEGIVTISAIAISIVVLMGSSIRPGRGEVGSFSNFHP